MAVTVARSQSRSDVYAALRTPLVSNNPGNILKQISFTFNIKKTKPIIPFKPIKKI